MFALAEQMGSTFVLQMDQNKARYLKNKMCMQKKIKLLRIERMDTQNGCLSVFGTW